MLGHNCTSEVCIQGVGAVSNPPTVPVWAMVLIFAAIAYGIYRYRNRGE